MKIGLAIAPEHASPSSFVVFRDRLEVSIAKAARLGYDGIELALSDAKQVDRGCIEEALSRHGLELPAISTGRVFAERKVWLTHPDVAVRREAIDTLKGLITLASRYEALVNIGRVRGYVHEDETQETAIERFLEGMGECADAADRVGVTLVLEPVNRYETNFVNSVPDAMALLERLARSNVKIMPDVFHMNIEDASIEGNLLAAGSLVAYVHFADSNRLAPGQGHLDFDAILAALRQIDYGGYITAEILPSPDPDTAAAQAIAYLHRLVGRRDD